VPWPTREETEKWRYDDAEADPFFRELVTD
jgi:hypothetical protein